MEYLLRPEEVEKLRGKIAKLEQEEANIYLKVKTLLKEDRDFVNSDEYKNLKRRREVDIPREIERIKEKLKHVTLVEDNKCEFDGVTVSLFTKVTLDYEGEIETYTIMPINELNVESGEISCNSPIAQCILGKKINDIICFNGMNVKIVNVEKV